MNKRSFKLWAAALSVLSLAAVAVALLPSFSTPKQIVTKQATSLALPAVSQLDHSRGSTESKVTIVIYSDLQCPGCAAVNKLMKGVEADYHQKVFFVYRHFPLVQHKNAILAAVAVEAAENQGKFFEMRDLIFQTQVDWAESTQAHLYFAALAVSLNLDFNKFMSDLRDPRVVQRIADDYKGGLTSGLNSAPSFFINGRLVKVGSEQELRQKIDEAINAR